MAALLQTISLRELSLCELRDMPKNTERQALLASSKSNAMLEKI